MLKNDILLSLGTILWKDIKKAIQFAKEIGYDGLEIVPTRKIISKKNDTSDLSFIKAIHHNWRLDIGNDKKYGIRKFTSFIFVILRFIFFPKVDRSKKFVQYASTTLNCPVTVHDITPDWTKDAKDKEFQGGIKYEILDISQSPHTLKKWLKNPKHFVEIDTRDDQSLLWGKNNGFKSWEELWMWIGLKKIKTIQLTLIGTKGIKEILNHKKNLPEQEFLWLHNKNWKGSVVIEVNPINLYLVNKRRLKEGLKVICEFVNQTLNLGEKWSN